MLQEYKSNLKQALKRSQSFLREDPDFYIETTGPQFINNESYSLLMKYLNEKVYSLPKEQVAQQCLHWSVKTQEDIERLLKCPALLTFGYIETYGKKNYYSPLEEIDTWSTLPPAPSRNIHGWLTLPSLEVIDITMMASYKVLDPEYFPGYSYRYCHVTTHTESSPIIRYFPQYAGLYFLEWVKMAKIG